MHISLFVLFCAGWIKGLPGGEGVLDNIITTLRRPFVTVLSESLAESKALPGAVEAAQAMADHQPGLSHNPLDLTIPQTPLQLTQSLANSQPKAIASTLEQGASIKAGAVETRAIRPPPKDLFLKPQSLLRDCPPHILSRLSQQRLSKRSAQLTDSTLGVDKVPLKKRALSGEVITTTSRCPALHGGSFAIRRKSPCLKKGRDATVLVYQSFTQSLLHQKLRSVAQNKVTCEHMVELETVERAFRAEIRQLVEGLYKTDRILAKSLCDGYTDRVHQKLKDIINDRRNVQNVANELEKPKGAAMEVRSFSGID